MHSDQESIRKSIKTYWMVGAALFMFTGVTVAVNQVHLAVPLAITVALIIATMKGSMVASVFMHLNHERKWIYGALILTVIGFILVMTLPSFTMMDHIGTPVHVAAPAAEHAGR
jgi:cytochrome c oxidase subunit IV